MQRLISVMDSNAQTSYLKVNSLCGDFVHSTVQSVFRVSDWTVKTVSTVYKDCCAELVIITQHFTDNFQRHTAIPWPRRKRKS